METLHHSIGRARSDTKILAPMNWAAELRQAFEQLHAGGHVQVGFAGREDTIGELGREFNALAAALEQVGARGLTREQVHSLRNHLAGILAAVHVLRGSGGLTAQDETALSAVQVVAQDLDARFRAG